MTNSVDIFDGEAAARVPDTTSFFHYDEELNAILMKCPVGGWEVFEDIDEVGNAVEELGEAVEKARDEGVAEYKTPLPDDPDIRAWD